MDLALHELIGKVFGVPVWRLLGDKRRDRVRMYCDTTGSTDPKKYAERMLARAGELITAVKDAIGWDAPLGLETSSGVRSVPCGPPVNAGDHRTSRSGAAPMSLVPYR